MAKRASGVLLHPSSLPGHFGIGDLGDNAVVFLDWLQQAGQTVWQILPLGPVGQGNSPYDAQSSFAGNFLLIDPMDLRRWDLITQEALQSAEVPESSEVDFNLVRSSKHRLLRHAWQNLQASNAASTPRDQLLSWVNGPDQRRWLDSWSLYAALKQHYSGQSWFNWPIGIRQRNPEVLEQARNELAEEIRFQEFVQFVFFTQWNRLRSEAGSRGISFLGDLPFYVAMDSCEVWTQPDLFDIDEAGGARTVAGVPPDYFSETGQRWGNPTYRWDRLADQGYQWWIERLRYQLNLVDRLRLDHFRGFAAYWAIPGDHETATNGDWRPGPGKALFDAVGAALGGLPFVAEDLGVITPDVDQLRVEMHLPGMKVLQFAFDSDDSPHLPHKLTTETVLYTGTHDNNTAQGWFQALDSITKQRVLTYIGDQPEKVHWSLLRVAQTSVADLIVAPAQDFAGLDARCRMNIPGTAEGNWGWRLLQETLTPELAVAARDLASMAGRTPPADV